MLDLLDSPRNEDSSVLDFGIGMAFGAIKKHRVSAIDRLKLEARLKSRTEEYITGSFGRKKVWWTD